MQTPAEKELVHQLHMTITKNQDKSDPPLILNIGAGKSVSIENQLNDLGCKYISDRIDIDKCCVEFPSFRNSCISTAENMAPVKSGEYVSAFANYVIEHIKDIKKMCHEIHRILIPSGTFIASIPNPIAPEFVLARHTPLWFHKKVRQEEAWETHYLYTIEDLINIFENNGMAKQSLKYWSFTEGYLWRYPLLSTFSRLYDRSITRMSIKRMMGDVCIVFKKV